MTRRDLSIQEPQRISVPAPPMAREAGASRFGETPPSDWEAFLQAIANHRGFVIGFTLVGALLGFAAARRLDPQYAAKAVLWIENSDADVIAGGAGSGRLLEATSWMDLLTSNAVLDTVVHSLRLYLTPPTTADAHALRNFDVAEPVVAGTYVVVLDRSRANYTLSRDDADIERGAVGGAIGHSYGFRWRPTADELTGPTRIEFTVTAPYEVTAALARELRGDVDEGASFLRLELRGADAARTTSTLNAIAARGVSVAASLKRQRLAELERILAEQYRHAEQDLRLAERSLSDFRVGALRRVESDQRGGATAAEETLEEVAALGGTRDQMRRDRQRLESLMREHAAGVVPLEALGAVRSVDAASPLRVAIDEATRRDAELRTLRYRYTEESAPVVEARASLERLTRREIPTLVQGLVAELAAREQAIAPRVDAAFGRLRRAPPLAIEESRLARRLEGAESLLGTVGERLEANRLALVSSLPDLHLLDSAREPRSPASDLAPLLVALSVLTSFGLSVAGARVRDQLDSRIRRPDQVTRELRLPILGCLPRVGWRRVGRGAQAADEVIESLRGLRVRLLQERTQGALCVTVTSPSSGDGKSFLSVNLALSFAQAGYRTLLVDGDVRRGVQHRVLGVAPGPGLVDVLAEETDLLSAIQTTAHPHLEVLSAGSRSPHAPELLAGPRLELVIAALRASHDVIVVDSPPLAAGVDAISLATTTEHLVLVLRSGMTDLPLAIAKLDAAEAHPVHLVGAVLNDVRGQGAFRYYGYDLTGYRVNEELPVDGRLGQRVLGGRPT